MESRERFLAACHGQPVDRPPIWLMRQAGRYLPEYRALRKQHAFWEMMRTPELAVEVTLQPLQRFGMDAAILFSDILTVLDAMGAEVAYEAGGPVVRPLVRSADDLQGFQTRGAEDRLAYVARAVEGLCASMHPEVAVIGFAGGPFTLAAYLVEEGPGRSLDRIRGLAAEQHGVFSDLLERISGVTAALLRLQVDAGADAVQIFDTWAGQLGPGEYEKLALPWVQKVIAGIRDLGVPITLYVRRSQLHLEAAASSGCTLLAVDDSVSLGEARKRLPPGVWLQGNLDPDDLQGPADSIREKVDAMIRDAGTGGYVVNLGRGLTPQTPVEGVEAMVAAVREWSP